MSINLAIQFHHPDAISHRVRYARIDNTTTPAYVNVEPNPVTSPAVIAMDIPAGQYQIESTPIYADGRPCDPEIRQTPACPGLSSISGKMDGNVMIVSYIAPSSVPKVRITIQYPNGGSFIGNFVNSANPISIGLPIGVYGNYILSGQSVCDESSEFYSPPSSSVTVAYNSVVSSSFHLASTAAGTCTAGVTTLYSSGAPAPGSSLFLDSGLSIPYVGMNFGMLNGVIYNITGNVLGNDTGVSCTAAPTIAGKTFYSSSSSAGSGTISATPGSQVTVTVVAGGIPGQTYTQGITIASGIGSVSATNGSNSITFTMPPSGVVSFTGVFTYTDTNGSGTISVS